MTFAAFPHAEPLHGLFGGLLIGVSAVVMLLGVGRIAGVSGITARAAGIARGGMSLTSAWAFIVGLPAGAYVVALAGQAEAPRYASWPVLVIAGLLVGFGTRLGGGCTSGHGVCGVSRFSQRSLVATVSFIASGVATVFVLNLVGALA